jgi:predicted transcriptional regulator of viral defense system
MKLPRMSAAAAILSQLARENRRVLSDWRALLLLRRATVELPAELRRWEEVPDEPVHIHPLLHRMATRGELASIAHLNHIYEVTVPYADRGVIDEEEILMEAHPYATISHLSALVYHGLTDDLPQVLTVMIPNSRTGGVLPPGTNPTDWEGVSPVRPHKPSRIGKQRVEWIEVPVGHYFGMRDYQPHGYPVRVTTPERTLVDGLQDPPHCGGFDNVLRAWSRMRDRLDPDVLVQVVEQFNIAVLRQRVGFILDELRITDPMVEAWRAKAKRGGSSRLLAAAPYAPTYSERWNLSINAPTAALHEDGA